MSEPASVGTALPLASALADFRARSALVIGKLRLLAWGATLLLAAFFGLARNQPDWRADLPLHALFFAVAAAFLFFLSRPRLREAASVAAPFLDVITVFLLQTDSLPRSPHPAGVAGWSLGPFVLLVLLASLSLRPGLIYASAAVAAAGEGYLQVQAGVGGGAVGASAVVLLVAAAATHWAARRIEVLVGRLVSEQVLAQLATARSAELLKAHAATAEAKAQLEAQHQKLLSAQREAEVLSSLLVHDMKGPLTTVLLRLDLAGRELEGRPELARLSKDLRSARTQGQRLLGMIEDLLAIARLEQGTLQARPQLLEVAPLLHMVSASFEGLAQTQGVSLAVVTPPGLRAPLDRELIERVLENLLSNALHYASDKDRVELAGSASNGQLLITVRNSGPKVPEKLRPRLFERFSGDQDAGRGHAGLGLYFCKLVAQAHRGDIQLEDEPSWNVSFVLRLPGS